MRNGVWFAAALIALSAANLPPASGASPGTSGPGVNSHGAGNVIPNGPAAADAGAGSSKSAGDDAAGAARWKAVQQAIFPGKTLQDGGGVVQIDAPPRALDAALVPVKLSFPGKQAVRSVWLIIDQNPSPLAAHVIFGPRADPRTLEMRVRVDAYTDLHAVAAMADGKLYSTAHFIKAAGGCSAPAGADDAAALKDLGTMKLRLIGPFTPGQPMQARLMIRHPNFNGMQMNQITRLYTSARFIRTIDATYDGGSVFHLDSDISLSSDPVITFGFVPQQKGQIRIVARDSSNATFDHSFDVPGAGS